MKFPTFPFRLAKNPSLWLTALCILLTFISSFALPSLKTGVTLKEDAETYTLDNGIEVPADDGPNRWMVDYAPGTIKVIGRNKGKDVAFHEQVTAQAPAKLILESEQKGLMYDWDEVGYVTATIADKSGIRFPNSDHKITFTLSGPGEIVAVDNADSYSHEGYKTNQRTAYKGKVTAIIMATAASGTIKLTATAEGLTSNTVEIKIIKGK